MPTKFKIFLQPPYVPGFEQPVTVAVDTGPDAIEPGPADPLLYVLDAVNKPAYRAQAPHEHQPNRGRAGRGNVNRSVAHPDAAGHFDHLAPDDPAFPAAAVYATARLAVNFWNRIFREAGHPELTKWHHRAADLEGEPDHLAPRLQLVPGCVSAGARSGYGYIEIGRDNPGHRYQASDGAQPRIAYQRGAMWQNFDVIAHEMGHAILFARVGFPASAAGVTDWFAIPEPEFLAFHESMADLMAILALLDLPQAREFVLTRKDGRDLAAGVGELQNLAAPGFLPIRTALNERTYSGNQTALDAHQNSMALTGAIFDALIFVYKADLYRTAAPTRADADRTLANACDVVAKSLADLWHDPDHLWDHGDARSGFSLPRVAERLPRLVAQRFNEQVLRAPAAGLGETPVAAAIEERIRQHFADRNFTAKASAAA